MSEAEPKGPAAVSASATGEGPSASPHHQTGPMSQQPGLSEERQAPTDIQAYIGTRLREVYNDVARQPIPDRFLDLMRQLDGK